MKNDIADAIKDVFEASRPAGYESGNIADFVEQLGYAVKNGMSGMSDAHVHAMHNHGKSIEAAASEIAEAISDLASAIREGQDGGL
jgi:hypothetical protein